MDQELQNIFNDILNGNREGIKDKIIKALDSGFNANQILFDAMVVAMDEVGRLYEEGEYFVPEMLISAHAMKSGLKTLKPHLEEKGIQLLGKIAIGTVKGDLHDIGKNLVGMMLEGAGFEVEDLGTDVDIQEFIYAIKNGAQIIGLSALLTTTMTQMKEVIQALEKNNLRSDVKIMIGGAPINQEYAEKIGADGFAQNASSAVLIAKKLIKAR